MSILLRDYNTYFDDVSEMHVLEKSHFDLWDDDVHASPLSLIKNSYIQHHISFRVNTDHTEIPRFIYEKLELQDFKIYHTKDELFAFLTKFYSEEEDWGDFEAYSREGNQAFLKNVLFPQFETVKECYVLNAEEISEEKTHEFGKCVYDYYLLVMWKDNEKSLNIGIVFSD